MLFSHFEFESAIPILHITYYGNQRPRHKVIEPTVAEPVEVSK